jgi:hypothetical protein
MDLIQRDLALWTPPPKFGEPLDLREKQRAWEAASRDRDLGRPIGGEAQR